MMWGEINSMYHFNTLFTFKGCGDRPSLILYLEWLLDTKEVVQCSSVS
jgi:hypothetical protein